MYINGSVVSSEKKIPEKCDTKQERERNWDCKPLKSILNLDACLRTVEALMTR